MRSILSASVLLALALAGCGTGAPKKPRKSNRVDDLIARLGDKEKSVRQKAEADLVKIGEAAVAPLIAVLSGEMARRTVSVGLLGTAKGGEVALLKGPENIRAYAARALGKIGDERAIDPLIEALADEDAGSAAEEALKRITKQDFGSDRAKWEAWRGAQDATEKKG